MKDISPLALKAAEDKYNETQSVEDAIMAYVNSSLEPSINAVCEEKAKRAEMYKAYGEVSRASVELREEYILKILHSRLTFMENMSHRYYIKLRELGCFDA